MLGLPSANVESDEMDTKRSFSPISKTEMSAPDIWRERPSPFTTWHGRVVISECLDAALFKPYLSAFVYLKVVGPLRHSNFMS